MSLFIHLGYNVYLKTHRNGAKLPACHHQSVPIFPGDIVPTGRQICSVKASIQGTNISADGAITLSVIYFK